MNHSNFEKYAIGMTNFCDFFTCSVRVEQLLMKTGGTGTGITMMTTAPTDTTLRSITQTNWTKKTTNTTHKKQRDTKKKTLVEKQCFSCRDLASIFQDLAK